MSRIGRRPVEIPTGSRSRSTGDPTSSRCGTSWGALADDAADDADRHGGGRRARRATRRPRFSRSLHGLTRSLWPTWWRASRRASRSAPDRGRLPGRDERPGRRAAGATRTRCSCPSPTDRVRGPRQVVVRGNDKQLVGETAANIRKIRKPEPYKGKGIRYENEYVRKKAGKAAKGRRPDGRQDETRRARAQACACPQDDRRHLGAAAPGRVPVQPAHLRAADRRPRGRDARVGLRRGGRWTARARPRAPRRSAS